MKCPKCGEEMKIIKKDESNNLNTGKKYSRTFYHCEVDDVWINVEIPLSTP